MILGRHEHGWVLGVALALGACDHGAKANGGGDAGGADGGSGDCPALPAAIGTGDAVGRADALVPRPRSIVAGEGTFALTSQSAISVRDEAARAVAVVLQERLARGTGYGLPVVTRAQESCFPSIIALELDASIVAPEAYRLHVEATRVTLSAGSPDGLARATATLRQLFAAEIDGTATTPRQRWLVPALTIDDAPGFRYRGVHLDVSRHFFSVAFVERYIDLLAAYKLNTLHFHLTDDQGWRIEILKYPRLAEVGGFRQEASGSYGGFYTQADIRRLVAYAAARGVTIVPEIELPGHASAALAAYPEYACVPGPIAIPITWGIFENVYCPSEETFAFLEDVLEEVIGLFPSPYVHIGGDEVLTAQWKTSPVAQAVMARENLASEAELAAYFVRRIEAFVREKGRTVIGWDEIAADGVPASAAIMAWRSASAGRAAAEAGHDVVMTPNDDLYFDHYQAAPAGEPPAIGGFTTVADVYGFHPLPDGIGAPAAAHILGAQANLWTEYMLSEKQVEYMLLPRALALAEVLWTDDPQRDYADFVARLVAHVPHLDAAGVSYAKHALTLVPQAPFGAVHALPGTLQLEDYDLGGEGVAYHDTSGGNQPMQYRQDDVDIEATAGGGHDVGYIDAGEWLEYTVAVASAGSYRLRFRAAAPQAGASFTVAVDGVDVSGPVAVPPTGSWTVFAERTGPMVALAAGTHVVRVSFAAAGCNVDWIALTVP